MAKTTPPTVRPLVTVDPHAVGTVASWTVALGLPTHCLPREIRKGRLEARKRGGTYWILGRWLLRWLETGTAHSVWDAAREEVVT